MEKELNTERLRRRLLYIGIALTIIIAAGWVMMMIWRYGSGKQLPSSFSYMAAFFLPFPTWAIFLAATNQKLNPIRFLIKIFVLLLLSLAFIPISVFVPVALAPDTHGSPTGLAAFIKMGFMVISYALFGWAWLTLMYYSYPETARKLFALLGKFRKLV